MPERLQPTVQQVEQGEVHTYVVKAAVIKDIAEGIVPQRQVVQGSETLNTAFTSDTRTSPTSETPSMPLSGILKSATGTCLSRASTKHTSGAEQKCTTREAIGQRKCPRQLFGRSVTEAGWQQAG